MTGVRACAALVVALMTAVASCSSSSSAPSSSSSPAVCSSLQQLQASVKNLTSIDPGTTTTASLRADLADVKRNAEAVGRDAKDHYANDVGKVRSTVSNVQAAALEAQNAPSAANVAAFATAVKNLGSAVRTLSDRVGSTC